jgi:hypothetical protein
MSHFQTIYFFESSTKYIATLILLHFLDLEDCLEIIFSKQIIATPPIISIMQSSSVAKNKNTKTLIEKKHIIIAAVVFHLTIQTITFYFYDVCYI